MYMCECVCMCMSVCICVYVHTVIQTSVQAKGKVKVKSLSCVRLFATPWTAAYQVPPSKGFSRQEYWRGLPFPSPGDLPDPGIKHAPPASPAEFLLRWGQEVVHLQSSAWLMVGPYRAEHPHPEAFFPPLCLSRHCLPGFCKLRDELPH